MTQFLIYRKEVYVSVTCLLEVHSVSNILEEEEKSPGSDCVRQVSSYPNSNLLSVSHIRNIIGSVMRTPEILSGATKFNSSS